MTVVISATDPGDNASGVVHVAVTRTGADTGSATYPGNRAEVTVAAEGATTLTYTAADVAGNTSEPQSLVLRIDTVAPSLQCSTDPAVLSPPNHKLRQVAVNVTASDSGSGPAGFALQSATSNEPDNGLGDGDTVADIQGWATDTADTTGQLRAERAGTGSGRTYTLSYQATDLAGNSTTCSALVTVPKSQGG